jgi:hypothetical protein
MSPSHILHVPVHPRQQLDFNDDQHRPSADYQQQVLSLRPATLEEIREHQERVTQLLVRTQHLLHPAVWVYVENEENPSVIYAPY